MSERSPYDDIAQKVAAVDDPVVPPPSERPGPFVLTVVDKAMEAVGVILLNIIVVLVLLNAGGRYLFSRPLVWTEEIVAGLLIWLVMVGAFLALQRRQMIASTALVDRWPTWAQAAAQLFANGLAAITFGFIAYVGWQYLNMFGGDSTPYFGFPKGFYLSALPVMAAAMALVAVFIAVESAARRQP
ncbi:MAG: TRAP transporter small permease [Pseudomonadota bacterium]